MSDLNQQFLEFNKGNTYSISPIEQAIDQEHIRGTDMELAFRGIYQQESGSGTNIRTSNQGAVGHSQIKPSTFASVADKGWNIHNPVHNLRAGIRYFKEMYTKSEGDFGAAFAGYNAGPKGIDAYKAGTAFKDKKNPHTDSIKYATSVLNKMNSLKPQIVPEESIPPEKSKEVGFPLDLLSPDFRKLMGDKEI